MKILLFLAGINGAIAVGLGAYGWHNLGDEPGIREVYMMGSEYQMWHALGIMGAAILLNAGGPKQILLGISGLFQLGIILFSGTLYVYGLFDTILLYGAAPVGGVLLILGWLFMASVGWNWNKKTA